jgi:type IV secretory pathway VirB10-like protein
VFMDSSVRCLCKMSGGTKVFATMEPGPLGFAVGTFSDGMRQVSEMPNCMLTVCKQQKKKAMKAMKAMKKQATKEKKAKPETKQAMKATKKQAMKEKEAMPEAKQAMKATKKQAMKEKEAMPEAKQAMKATKKQAMKVMKKPCAGVSYCIMLYKKDGARALRIQGGKQLFQIKTAVPGESQLILEEARDRMQAGGQLEDVMAWAKTQATP